MKQCLVCNSSSFSPIYNNTLLRCSECKFVTANLEINEASLKQIYSVNYYKGEEYLDYEMDKELIQQNFTKRLKYILKKIDKNKIKDVLEIGCAYGFFGQTITEKLKEIEYVGYDISEDAVKYGKEQLNQNIYNGNYLTIEPNKRYSDIFMWDVIEHLPKPDLFIKKIARESTKGSRLYITTGDMGALMPRLRKDKWRLIHPPSHLHYFSKKTLSKLLSDNGFEIVDISYPAFSRSIKLIYYSLFMLNKKYPVIIEKIYNVINPKWSIAISMKDIIFIIAEKKK